LGAAVGPVRGQDSVMVLPDEFPGGVSVHGPDRSGCPRVLRGNASLHLGHRRLALPASLALDPVGGRRAVLAPAVHAPGDLLLDLLHALMGLLTLPAPCGGTGQGPDTEPAQSLDSKQLQYTP